MFETLEQVVGQLGDFPKIQGHAPRVYLNPDQEYVIKGTIGPDVSEPFRQLIGKFNNAPDQQRFFEEEMAGLKFS